MIGYIERELTNSLLEYIKIFPVTLVTGPRQSGKSTFLKNILKDYTYLTFDDFKTTNFFREDPEGFFNKYKSKIIFDEVQKEPSIFNFIKKYIDENRSEYGKYILTGSNQFIMLEQITESLAGRIGLLTLLPFQRKEIKKDLRDKSIFKGGYPELVVRNYANENPWYSAYIDTYLNKDVRQLSKIGDMRDFRKLVELLAANTSQILNMTTYSKELGISVSTIKRWISVLEASYVIFLLEPFHNNLKKRIIKSPKIYFYDTGLVSYITGIETQKHFDSGPMAGAIFENYIISELEKIRYHNNKKFGIFYIRTSNRLEVDLVIKSKGKTSLIEIKKNSSLNFGFLKPIKTFLKNDQKGYLVYTGENYKYSDNLQIFNYKDFLEQSYMLF